MGAAELVNGIETKNQMRHEVESERFYSYFLVDYLLIKVMPNWLQALVPGYRVDFKALVPHGMGLDRFKRQFSCVQPNSLTELTTLLTIPYSIASSTDIQ